MRLIGYSCYQSQNYKIWKQFTTNLFLPALFCPMLSITKLQNLKAIHNANSHFLFSLKVVINHKTTKFESNSQHLLHTLHITACCYQSQNYKIWKQFTTLMRLRAAYSKMLSITKLQNLKAIHNRFIAQILIPSRCYQSQNYKIWKQFTTRTSKKSIWGTMLSIIKLQNLKAIHNKASGAYRLSSDVINHKTTKFESNSQLASVRILSLLRCYQS